VTTTPAAFGLEYPTFSDAHQALRQVYEDWADQLWPTLLQEAGLSGHEADRRAVRTLIETMVQRDSVTRLIGRSLLIRAISHDRLCAVQEILESTP
jgi:hypothetical protein